MHQGYNYGSMPMPRPQYGGQTGPGTAATRPFMNTANATGRSQTDSVMSQLSTKLDQADQSELQELHDQEEKLHHLLNENNEVIIFCLLSNCQMGEMTSWHWIFIM